MKSELATMKSTLATLNRELHRKTDAMIGGTSGSFGGTAVHVTFQYRYLGSVVCSTGDYAPEMSLGIGTSIAAENSSGKQLMGNRQLPVRMRSLFTHALAVSRRTFSAGTWGHMGGGHAGPRIAYPGSTSGHLEAQRGTVGKIWMRRTFDGKLECGWSPTIRRASARARFKGLLHGVWHELSNDFMMILMMLIMI